MLFINEFINPEDGTIRVVREDDNKRILLVQLDECGNHGPTWYNFHEITTNDIIEILKSGRKVLEDSDVIDYVVRNIKKPTFGPIYDLLKSEKS